MGAGARAHAEPPPQNHSGQLPQQGSLPVELPTQGGDSASRARPRRCLGTLGCGPAGRVHGQPGWWPCAGTRACRLPWSTHNEVLGELLGSWEPRVDVPINLRQPQHSCTHLPRPCPTPFWVSDGISNRRAGVRFPRQRGAWFWGRAERTVPHGLLHRVFQQVRWRGGKAQEPCFVEPEASSLGKGHQGR